jgi:hypothetical protein
MPVGLAIYRLPYNQFTTPENVNESKTQIPVHTPASFELIMWGVLLNTPKSRAKKTKMVTKKIIQTIMLCVL